MNSKPGRRMGSRTQIGTYVGCVVGACSWLIGLTFVCVFTRQWDVLGQVFFPGFAASLALGLAAVVVRAAVVRLVGTYHWLVPTSVLGMVLLFCGVLILLINHWVAPLIDQCEDMRLALAGWAIYRTTDVFPTVLLTVAVILLGRVAFALLRAPIGSGAPGLQNEGSTPRLGPGPEQPRTNGG